ncbi:MAG: hypothetical protein QM817_31520 [Archangium sp.]
MTVRRTGTRTPVSSGCGSSSTRGTSKPSPRKPVATGCGTSSSSGSKGWSAKTGGKVSDKVSQRSKDLLDKAEGKTGRRTTSSGCGTSSPSKPSPHKPTPKPTRTGC